MDIPQTLEELKVILQEDYAQRETLGSRWYNWLFTDEADLKEANADYEFDEFEEMLSIVESESALVRVEGAETTTQTDDGFHLSDLGDAQRLVKLSGEDLRYCSALGWLVWIGTHWARDDTKAITRRAVRSLMATYHSSQDAALRRYVRSAEKASRVRSSLELASAQSEVVATTTSLDRNQHLFNTANGTFNLRTGQLQSHSREDLLTKCAPVTYDPDAVSPLWDAYLESTLPDLEVRAYLQRAMGYSLTGFTSEQCLFFIHGKANTGKTTFIEIFLALLGPYATTIFTETLATTQRQASRSSASLSDVALLRGVRAAIASETEDGSKLNEALVKTLTGNKTLRGKKLYKDPFSFACTHKLWLEGNYKPQVRGTGEAIWRRIKVIPFETIIKAIRIPDLQERIIAEELPGVLNWALEGLRQYQEQGLGTAQRVKQASEEYREDMDRIQEWLNEECTLDSTCRERVGETYKAYSNWCKENGYYPLGRGRFAKQLSNLDGISKKKSDYWYFYGITLTSRPITSLTINN